MGLGFAGFGSQLDLVTALGSNVVAGNRASLRCSAPYIHGCCEAIATQRIRATRQTVLWETPVRQPRSRNAEWKRKDKGQPDSRGMVNWRCRETDGSGERREAALGLCQCFPAYQPRVQLFTRGERFMSIIAPLMQQNRLLLSLGSLCTSAQLASLSRLRCGW